MKTIFLGTPDFAAVVLDKLIKSKHEILAVVTQPDKPRSRGEVSYSPVKKLAIENGISVLQYDNISSQGVDELVSFGADIMITAAYGQILSQRILNICPFGVINVHASLLPKYRGAAPIQWAVINGEKQTGVTIMQTEHSLDSGDIIYVKKIDINEGETAGELFDRLSDIGADALLSALELIESGNAVYTPQNDAEATYCKQLKKTDGKIDFGKSYAELKNFIAGVTPWPTAFTLLNGKIFKVYKIAKAAGSGVVGTVLSANQKDGLIVAIKDGAIEFLEVQPENGKKMSAKSYLLGHSVAVGTLLGE